MGVEDLPNGFYVPTRDEIRDQFQQDVRLYVPGAPIGDGSQAHADGSIVADTLAPLYADGLSMARNANLDDMTLDGLKAEARGMGIPELLPASGGGGFVQIAASAGGVAIESGRELYDEKTSLRFVCAKTQTYFDGQPVPVVGFDTGPTTNLPAGTVLKWRSPPAGLGANATILADSNGDGFKGGRNEETADELRDRIRYERANPAAAGNTSHVQRLVRLACARLGIALQDVFVYPCLPGPGCYAIVFTLRPARPGGSRAPDVVQVTQVRSFITGALPEDDGIISCVIVEQDVTVILGIEWALEGTGWTDADPWPRYDDNFAVIGTPSPTTFDVEGDPSAAAPQVGQTIAFFDTASVTFKQKRIAAVTDLGGDQYTIAVDEANGASDLVYTPAVGERPCPWSDALQLLVEPMAQQFDGLGPGEQVASFFDAGTRQRRVPAPTATTWPSTLRHKMLDGVDDLPQVADVTVLSPALPYVTPVGTAGVSSTLLAFSRLLAFPIS